MATTFLEPGGDATFNVALTSAGGFWSVLNGGGPTLVTDFVHGTHVNSLQYQANNRQYARTPSNVLADTGTRVSFYIYLVARPTATATIALNSNSEWKIKITSGGVVQLTNSNDTQIGSNGAVLSTGQWYRISLAYTVTSFSVNRFELFVNGLSSISITNGSLIATGGTIFQIGQTDADLTLDFRSSDHYIDNSSSLTDTGDIWVTAKRPNANGTTNGFSTQIGSGGSGYGTGHSPQVNERPLSTTNGWSMVGAGSAVTEEYNIEGKAVGDIDISAATIVDFMAWAYASSLASETATLFFSEGGGNQTSGGINLTSTNTMFSLFNNPAQTGYPAGTGTDIGITTTTALTTVNLYECGIIVAYIPPPPVIPNIGSMLLMFK